MEQLQRIMIGNDLLALLPGLPSVIIVVALLGIGAKSILTSRNR